MKESKTKSMMSPSSFQSAYFCNYMSRADAQGSVPHRRMCLEHVANLLAQVLRSLTEVEVLEWVTTSVGR